MPSDRRHLASLVLDFERLGGDVAVVEQHGLRRKVTTYGELAVLAKRYAAELARRGIRVLAVRDPAGLVPGVPAEPAGARVSGPPMDADQRRWFGGPPVISWTIH